MLICIALFPDCILFLKTYVKEMILSGSCAIFLPLVIVSLNIFHYNVEKRMTIKLGLSVKP